MGFNNFDPSTDNPFDISNMMTNDLWNFASTSTASSNYVWPTGFTPEGQPSSGSTMSIQGQGNTMNPIQLPQQQQQRYQEPTIGHFMNTSPNTDMRLLNALESGAAYIEGNPAEDEDIELFYYRFVSYSRHYTQQSKEKVNVELTIVRCNGSTPRYKSNIPQTPKKKRIISNRSTT
jgi:hypothetical protein